MDTTFGVSADALPASAYDSALAASITVFACASSTGSVSRELGPEMQTEPSSFQS